MSRLLWICCCFPFALSLLLLAGCVETPGDGASEADSTAAAPATDIYLATIAVEDGAVRLEDEPLNITQREGYDNQPHFTPDGRALLYTSVRDGQADTYRYDLAEGTTRQVTNTPESEYSPTPRGDGFSVVRVEEDGTQRLWQFANDGSDAQVLVPNIEPVGYHAWATPDRVALFVLGEPPTLQLADVGTAADTLARDIGTSLQAVPGRPATVSFIQHTADSTAEIRLLDARARTITPVVEALPGGDDDHAWTPEGHLLMARDSTLYQYDPEGEGNWQSVADLAPLRDVTRLAVSPDGDRLALVAAE